MLVLTILVLRLTCLNSSTFFISEQSKNHSNGGLNGFLILHIVSAC